ncbi:protein Turandot X [Drosophila ficusphila]|uniref:protein Turandot X n=1 Tax=Drosophila ficusphila TaxID=30025 RepID=UPI0007E758D1|nr:protein Turandot X [Drosophila ficusphila]
MRFYFISILTLFIGYFCSASADINDPNYDADRNSILDIFHNPAVNNSTKERNIPELINFYRRYPNAVHLTDVEKQQFEGFIREYQGSRNVLIDGVPAQGGSIGYAFGHFLGKLGTGYFRSLFNKKKEDESKRASTSTVKPPRVLIINLKK